MPIKSIQPGQAGVSNTAPSWVYIETNDTIATVTTAGYLSGAAREYVNTFQPNMMALVSTKTSQNIGVQPVLYLLQLTVSNGVWSLTAPAVDVPVPFIVEGDIQAGSSGVAGDFISFPSAASKGSLIFKAVANTGNTNTTVSNAAMGQASVISIPDPGVATAKFILSDNSGTQHITTGSLEVDVGNLLAGSSGHAGTVSSFPGTASKGSLILAAVNNTGNTNTTISNAAMGQASVVSIPDPGVATANFILSDNAGTQHITTGSFEVDVGNISAGKSGAAGTLNSFPGTAANGQLIVAAVNAGGAFNTTISNGTMGQSTVYTMGDIGASTGGLVVATSAIRMKSVAGAAAAGGAAAQSFTDAFCTSSSNVVGNWNTQANAASVLQIVPGNGSFVVTSSADAGVGTFNYIITK